MTPRGVVGRPIDRRETTVCGGGSDESDKAVGSSCWRRASGIDGVVVFIYRKRIHTNDNTRTHVADWAGERAFHTHTKRVYDVVLLTNRRVFRRSNTPETDAREEKTKIKRCYDNIIFNVCVCVCEVRAARAVCAGKRAAGVRRSTSAVEVNECAGRVWPREPQRSRRRAPPTTRPAANGDPSPCAAEAAAAVVRD